MLITSYLITAIAELLVTDITARRLFQCQRKSFPFPQVLWFIYLFFSVLHISFNYILNFNLLVSALLTILVCYSYYATWPLRIVTALVSISIGLASEGLLWLLVRSFTFLNGQEISPHFWHFTIMTFCSAIIQVVLIILIHKVVEYFKKHTFALYLTTLIVTAFLLITALLLLVTYAETQYLPTALAIIVLIFIAMILLISMFKDRLRIQQERLRLDFLEQQSHDQLTHYTALYENSNEVHRIRHDLKNFIIGVRALAAQKDYDGLEAQLEQFQESVQPHALVDTGNPVLDAVLTAKQTAAPNIEFQMNIVQLNCQHIDPMDVAMLAASALDNAIEGCANISSPYIEISVQRKNEMISLLVKNPTTNKPEVKRGRIVTTKPDPERHGYGILGMQRIVDKYDGNLRWSVKDGEFILSIFLQDKPMIKT